jgi:UDP-N-acetyl-D-mannosaminuronic acid dehydrogenase
MKNEFKSVSMIGLGYIGLPTAAVIASRGVDVIGVDVNVQAVETINSGRIHIVEPDLDALVHEVVRQGKLRATTQAEQADAYLIAVPTPFKDDHKPDLDYVEAAARSVAKVLKKGDLVILESTSPVGTTEQLATWMAEDRPDLSFPQQAGGTADINVAYCPERVLPGKVIQELVDNDRVIGGMTETCAKRAQSLYRIFVRGECLITNARTAEMCKLTENSFRDVNIAFANELSLICDELSINVWDLVRLANRHPRVNILQPGPGVGGHCIAVDPWFIVDSAPDSARIIRTARLVNDSKPEFVIGKVLDAARNLSNPVIACLGLAFKPDIDDLRESPALEITKVLAEKGLGRIIAVEPNIDTLPAALSGQVELMDLEEACALADIIVILVDHRQFLQVDWSGIDRSVIVDTKGVLSRKSSVA